MGHNKIAVVKEQGGLGRRAQNLDNVIAIIANGVAVSGKLVLNTAYKCRSIKDVIALGITDEYDAANAVLLYHHLKRIYTRNKSAEIHLAVVAQARTMAQMVDPTYTTNYNAKNLLAGLNGRPKYLGVIRNPTTGYTPTLSGGFDADVLAAIPKAQALYTSEADAFRYCQIVLEGRSFNGTASAATDLRNISGVDAPNVSVVIMADPVTSAAHANYAGYAAVGDVMGCISVAAVSQSIAENNKALFNLQNVAAGFYSAATDNPTKCIGLSSGLTLAEANYNATDLDTLNEKGYIYGEPVPGLDGLYLNDAHTCIEIESDYAYIENNAVIDKAIRLARPALLPSVNARFKADTTTGQLDATTEKGLIQIAVDALEVMEIDGDISGGIEGEINPDNPDYNLIAGDNLEVALNFVPMVIGRNISLRIGFKNPKG